MPGISGMSARAPTLMKIRSASEQLVIYTHRARTLEARMPAIERGVRQAFYPARHAGARLKRNPVFARLNVFHVDPQPASNLHAIFGSAAGLVRNPRACHQRLGRNTARVNAGTAYMLALDDCGPESLLRETVRERW